MKSSLIVRLAVCSALVCGGAGSAYAQTEAPADPQPPADAQPPADPQPPAAGAPETAAPAPGAPAPAAPAPSSIDLESLPPASLEIEGLAVEAGGLTAPEVARRALAASSGVHEKRAELAAANARIAQTTIEFLPRLNLRASYTYLPRVAAGFGQGALLGARNQGVVETAPCADGSGTCVVDSMGEPVVAANTAFVFPEHNYTLQAGLSVPLSDYILRVSDAAAGASASREAARYALEAEQRRVRTDSQVLYYNWLRAHAQVYIARRSLERTAARLADARAALAVGRLANADVMRIEAVAANAVLALQQAEALRALTGAQLAIVMRDPSGGDKYRIGQGVPQVAPPAVTPELARERVAEALRSRLELKALDAAARALGHGEDATRAGAWPRLEAVADGMYANPNSRFFPPQEDWRATWSAGVQATFQLDAPFLSDARGDELAANRQATLGRRSGLEGAIANEVVTAQVEVLKSQAAIAAGETSVRATEESYRVTTDRFQVGRATPTDLIDAESELLAAKLTVVNARIDLVIAALRLDYALGREDRGPLATK